MSSVRNQLNAVLEIYLILENDVDDQLADNLLMLHEITDVEEDSYAYRASLRNEDRLIEVS